jgi:hypothetical protein
MPTALATGGTHLILFLVVLVVAILALIGAILGLASKRGTLALIAGLILVIFNLLWPLITPSTLEITLLGQFSSSTVWEFYLASIIGFSFYFTIYLTLETILIVVGGIIATASSE